MLLPRGACGRWEGICVALGVWVFWREGLEVWRCSFQGRPVTLPTASVGVSDLSLPRGPDIHPAVRFRGSLFSGSFAPSFSLVLTFNPSAIFFSPSLQSELSYAHGNRVEVESTRVFPVPGAGSSSCIPEKVSPDGQALLQFWKHLPALNFFFLGCRKKEGIGEAEAEAMPLAIPIGRSMLRRRATRRKLKFGRAGFTLSYVSSSTCRDRMGRWFYRRYSTGRASLDQSTVHVARAVPSACHVLPLGCKPKQIVHVPAFWLERVVLLHTVPRT